jgi:bifunctional enzyme CysN/CysC
VTGKRFSVPVRLVKRGNPDFRSLFGLHTTGVVDPGDTVRVLPSGKKPKFA